MSITVGRAIDPLLGYLSSAIGDEAQLLDGVHRDAQFIQDELESMNAFLHQLAEASTDHDYLVRQWRKQVRDLAIDTQCCIDLYAHRVGRARAPRARGVWGHVHRAIFFLQTIPARHQVATQVRELKTRARDISERRQRYGVQVLPKATNEIDGRSGCGGGNALLLHNAYRRDLVDIEPLKDETLLLIHWLCKQALLHPEETEAGPGWPIVVIAVVAHDKADVGDLVKEVYNHSSLPGLFDCKAFVTIQRPLFLPQVLDDMIQKLRIPHEAASDYQQHQQLEELKRQVKGRRFFVVVENPRGVPCPPSASPTPRGGTAPTGSCSSSTACCTCGAPAAAAAASTRLWTPVSSSLIPTGVHAIARCEQHASRWIREAARQALRHCFN